MSKIQFSKVMIFQSTHPLRDATDQLDLLGGLMDISIHAPLAGCDAERPVVCIGAGGISIHAPLAGCDMLLDWLPALARISIHAPLAGCDGFIAFTSGQFKISIHAPLAGCDPFTTASKAATLISIHAPLAGCDSSALLIFRICPQFQSTHPLRDATKVVSLPYPSI